HERPVPGDKCRLRRHSRPNPIIAHRHCFLQRKRTNPRRQLFRQLPYVTELGGVSRLTCRVVVKKGTRPLTYYAPYTEWQLAALHPVQIMAIHVAFLRAVNVGGRNLVPMSQL